MQQKETKEKMEEMGSKVTDINEEVYRVILSTLILDC